MCDYTKVEYSCGHVRYLVRAWCVRYQETHRRCPPNIVAQEWLSEKCGDCRDTSSTRLQTTTRRTNESNSNQETNSSSESPSGSSSTSNTSTQQG